MSPTNHPGGRPSSLTEADVQQALDRLRSRDADLARDAEHIYDVLTWGQGPNVLQLAGLQDWLWYELPAKYTSSEPGYMGDLADTAARLFDELGLAAYAELCRSETTAEVHAAWSHSDTSGRKALRKANDASPLVPVDLDDFAWGSVFGIEESSALLAVEAALEDAIISGELVPGSRGWRIRQKGITAAAAFDGDHPAMPGQSWRTAVLTERVEAWVHTGGLNSERHGRRRADIANRLLSPIEPPVDLEQHMRPLQRLLELFGEKQRLTQSGFLNRSFVVRIVDEKLWEDEFLPVENPRSEADVFDLHDLRLWLQTAGALRKARKVLRRTELGTDMATDATVAWRRFTTAPTSDPWERFVLETAALVLLGETGPASENAVIAEIRRDAGDLGWRTQGGGGARLPLRHDVFHALRPTRRIMEICGLVTSTGPTLDRTLALSPAGEATLLAILRHTATGPREGSG